MLGGEDVWLPLQLPAGTNRLHLVTRPANTGPVSFTVGAQVPAKLPAAWSGVSMGAGTGSRVRIEVPDGGVYRLNYGLGSGRYGLKLDIGSGSGIVKTVEAAGSASFYLPQGSAELIIYQDPKQEVTAWSLNVESCNCTADRLPYSQAGGSLGGPGNVFTTERMSLFYRRVGRPTCG